MYHVPAHSQSHVHSFTLGMTEQTIIHALLLRASLAGFFTVDFQPCNLHLRAQTCEAAIKTY